MAKKAEIAKTVYMANKETRVAMAINTTTRAKTDLQELMEDQGFEECTKSQFRRLKAQFLEDEE